MKIYVALVDHRNGHNWFAARSEAGASKQLAAYVRENWDEVAGTHVGHAEYADVDGEIREDHRDLDDDLAVRAYFENHPDETYVVESFDVDALPD